MASHGVSTTDRRAFLGQLAGAAVALAGTACASAGGASAVVNGPAPSSAGAALPAVPPPQTKTFDDTWTTRLSGVHKSVYDSPAINDGDALDRASSVMQGYHAALGTTDADLSVVIVIRHAAIPMALNDAMWEKYAMGKGLKLKDPTTGETANRNPFLRVSASDKYAMVDSDSSLERLRERGVVLLGCNMALIGRAYSIARQVKAKPEVIVEEFRNNLVPGLILQPNGIYAVARAQEMGCALISAGGSAS